jgi:uncharacterized protein (DUF2267 family)
MANTGLATFNDTVQETNELLGKIEDELGWEDRREQTYAAFRNVLHVFRDRLPVNVSANFAAQLPMLVKGIYFDGWNPADMPKDYSLEEFLAKAHENFPYDVEGGMEKVSKVVFKHLFDTIDEGEAKEIKGVFPDGYERLWE